MAQAVAKVRSRKDGAAIPLDDTDKQLLNLLQGHFPIERRPFERIADAAGLTHEDVLARTDRLVRERIIREITPIFDTRALGYQSMLVAAKVDPEHPQRAAVLETLTSIRRAGADAIVTYYAKEAASWLR